MMYYGNFGNCWGSWPFSFLGGILNILIIILFVVILIRLIRRSKGENWRPWSSSAEEMLKERFVKGEITKEDYEEKLKILRS